jgi:hypothetical protein
MAVSSGTITKFNQFIMRKTGGYDDLSTKWSKLRKCMFKMLPLVELKEKTMEEIFHAAEENIILAVPEIKQEEKQTIMTETDNSEAGKVPVQRVTISEEQKKREAGILNHGLHEYGQPARVLAAVIMKRLGVEFHADSAVSAWRKAKTAIPRQYIPIIEQELGVDFGAEAVPETPTKTVKRKYTKRKAKKRTAKAATPPAKKSNSQQVAPVKAETATGNAPDNLASVAHVYGEILGTKVSPQQAARCLIGQSLCRLTPDPGNVVQIMQAAGCTEG